jgi:general secretion pathway protein H
MCRQRGFTLLELLVVLLIMGLAVTMVGISIGNGSPQRDTRQYAQWFARSTGIALQEAEAQGRNHGVALYQDDEGAWHWQWYRQINGKWLDLVPAFAPATPLQDYASPQLRVEGKFLDLTDRNGNPAQRTPDIVLFASGELTPFELLLDAGAGQKSQLVGVCGNAVGQLRVDTDIRPDASGCGESS